MMNYQNSEEKNWIYFSKLFSLPGLTAQENVVEGLLYQGIKREERLEKAAKVLKEVGLGDRLTHLPTGIVWWTTTKSSHSKGFGTKSGIYSCR